MLDWCADAGGRGDPLRRRHQRRRRGRAADGRRSTRARSRSTSERMDRVLEVDAVSRAARIQAGATGPGARGPAARARAHPAPLPAVVRVLDARRLDRDPRRRPLRDPLHPHRRPGRVGAGGDPGGRVGEPAAAGLRRRAQPRPDAARLRGDPRRDHRGLGAGAGAARLRSSRAGSPSTTSRPAPRPCARSPSPGSTRPTAACSTRRSRRLTPRARPARRCWCSASSRRTIRSTSRWRSRSRLPATTAASRARCERSGERSAARARRAARGAGAQPSGRGPGRRLAPRLPLRPLPARLAGRLRGPLATPSRPRSPGTASPDFHAEVMETARRAVAEACGRTAEGRARRGSAAASPTSIPDGPAPYYTVLAPGQAGGRGRAVGRDQGRRLGRGDRRRRHDHPPPRGRPRPPALVRPPAPRAVRRRAARRKARARPEGRSSTPAC